MSQRLVVSNIQTGYETDVLPFNVSNDAFPVLQDAQIYRGRVRRKRGTYPLGRLQRTLTSTQTIAGAATSLVATISFPAVSPEATLVSQGLDAHVDFAISGATQANPCVLTVVGNTFTIGQHVTISDVIGMTELNGNTYAITNVAGNNVTINVDSTGFTAYSSGGTAFVYGQIYRTITGISNAASAVVTSNNHNIPNGSTVLITNVIGLYTFFTITGVTNSEPIVVTVNNTINPGDVVTFSGVNGMIELNGQQLYVIEASPTSITVKADSTDWGKYTSGGTVLDTSQSAVNNLTFTTSAATANTFTINVDTSTYSSYSTGGTASLYTNLLTGANLITFNPAFSGDSTVTIDVEYYPNLPVMGIEDYDIGQAITAPINVFFDTVYAYEFNSTTMQFFDVSFYKDSNAPVTWTGANYQQFWSANFQGAFWVTNNNPGINIVFATFSSGSGTTAITFNFKTGSLAGSNLTTLVDGDQVWFNEWTSGGVTINGLTGEITDSTGSAAGNYVVTFFSNQTVSGTGIGQLLTNQIAGSGDGIRWFDGTNFPTQGWVNFAPPLSSDTHPFYLIGCLAIVPFKDRLCCFNCVTYQISTGTKQFYPDAVFFPQNGTVYYSIAPLNQTVDVSAWYQITSKGGFERAGLNQNIVTVINNEDVLLVGLEFRKTKLVYTGLNSPPFLFYSVNPEYTTSCTFSGIALDIGGIDIGTYGITLTSQTSSQRIDLPILQQVFNDFSDLNDGYERVCGIRDFWAEYIYWSYNSNEVPSQWLYPTRTLAYNYRNGAWAYFQESYTHYGTYRPNTPVTWGNYNVTWGSAAIKWGYGGTLTNFPEIACGNQQGFIVLKDVSGCSETATRFIADISISGNVVTINCPDHCLDVGYVIYIQGCLGTTGINNRLFEVYLISTNGIFDKDNFTIRDSNISGSYLGGGTITIIADPQIQTKSFNFAWDRAQKTRFGTQRYFFTRAPFGEVTIATYVDQDYDTDVNGVPFPESNQSNLASNIVITDVENDSPFVAAPDQIWHRMSNSFFGDTIAVKVYLSQDQKLDPSLQPQFAEIELHAFVMDAYPGPTIDYYLQ
ncbi:MAG TPA: ubiquitin-activating E1 FCCH domain-containing protein [Chitinophagaceae bacterium]|nr:ubiquitin-activating E1 FCCH domain-containing protein [Chitinophagaceae bacterium]